MSRALVLVALLAAPAAAGPLPASAFAYDAKAPLDLRDEAAPARRGAAAVRDVSFAVGGARVRAFLVAPAASPARAGVLFVHWLGEPATTNRSEFLDDAVELAGHGTTSLLVDTMWAAPKWFSTRTCDGDYAASIQQVVALRRALDVLLARPGVDRRRVAFVGHDFGGMYGTILAAVDGRPSWYVLMTVTTKLSDWYLLGAPPKSKPAYLAEMAPLEPVSYLAGVRARGLFFQFARTDEYVTPEHAAEYAAAAPEPKRVTFYDADHGLAIAAARADRVAWLEAQLAR